MKNLRLWLLPIMLLCLLPSTSLALEVNDGIYATMNLNTRSSPSTSGTLLATIPSGTGGLIVGGPVSANGYVWYQVLWAYGNPLITGWSIQDYMATTAPSSTVYTDYLWPGWHHQNWSNMTANYSSSTKRSGTYGIQATASAAYSRLYIETNIGYSTSGQQTLRFSMMNPTSGNVQRFSVSLYNTSGSAIHYVPVHSYVSGGNLNANTWYDIIIPISDLQATNQTIGGVVVEIGATGTFYVDELSFSTSSGSTYWNPPTITSVSVSCNPTSVHTNSTSQCIATVSGTGSYNSAVSWGASAGSINSSGFYTAPSSVPNPSGVSIVATSYQDPSKYGSATMNITSSVSQSSSIVFGDSVGTGWNIGSWTQVAVDPTSDVSYQGTYGLQAQIATGAWGRVKFQANSGYKFNTAGNNYLAFAINIGKYEGENLYVGLLNQGGTVITYVNLPASTFEAYQWKVIYIPLSTLSGISTDVYGVEVQSAAASTFFLDSIKFKGDCNGL